MTEPTNDLEALAAKAADAYEAFERARNAMNAARPDPMHATPAERALYDERYKADHEAERTHWTTAIQLAQNARTILTALRSIAAPKQDAEVAAYRDALDPDKMKGVYLGEFNFPISLVDDDGNDYSHTVAVPWYTIKEIMSTISRRAALAHPPAKPDAPAEPTGDAGVLAPCPFCGNDPVPDYCSSTDGPAYLFHCQAKDCPAWPNVQGETEAEAIAAWNTRPAPKGIEPQEPTPPPCPFEEAAADTYRGVSCWLDGSMNKPAHRHFNRQLLALAKRGAEIQEALPKEPLLSFRHCHATMREGDTWFVDAIRGTPVSVYGYRILPIEGAEIQRESDAGPDLLSTPANADRLRSAIAQMEADPQVALSECSNRALLAARESYARECELVGQLEIAAAVRIGQADRDRPVTSRQSVAALALSDWRPG